RRVLGVDAGDGAGLLGLEVAEQLHHLDEADGLARLHRVAHLHQGRFVRRAAAVESADHRCRDRYPVGWCLVRGGYRDRCRWLVDLVGHPVTGVRLSYRGRAGWRRRQPRSRRRPSPQRDLQLATFQAELITIEAVNESKDLTDISKRP